MRKIYLFLHTRQNPFIHIYIDAICLDSEDVRYVAIYLFIIAGWIKFDIRIFDEIILIIIYHLIFSLRCDEIDNANFFWYTTNIYDRKIHTVA